MRCELDHRDGGVCQALFVNGHCPTPEQHADRPTNRADRRKSDLAAFRRRALAARPGGGRPVMTLEEFCARLNAEAAKTESEA